MAAFSSKLSATTKHERETILEAQILESLRFNTMVDRFESIVKAHKKTFGWAYMKDEAPNAFKSKPDSRTNKVGSTTKENVKVRHWNNLMRWMQSDSSLYWITGKPGSGKSTHEVPTQRLPNASKSS